MRYRVMAVGVRHRSSFRRPAFVTPCKCHAFLLSDVGPRVTSDETLPVPNRLTSSSRPGVPVLRVKTQRPNAGRRLLDILEDDGLAPSCADDDEGYDLGDPRYQATGFRRGFSCG